MTEDESRKAFAEWIGSSSAYLNAENWWDRSLRQSAWDACFAWMKSQQAWRPMDSAPRDERVILKLPNRIEIAHSRPLMSVTWVFGERIEEAPRYRWFYENGTQVTEEMQGWLPLPPMPEEKG